MILEDQCPIWGTAAKISLEGSRDGVRVFSPRAGGEYFVSRRVQHVVPDFDEHRKARMTSWLYEQRRLGIHCPEIMEYKLDDILQRKPLEIPERVTRILRHIQSKTIVVGTEVFFNMTGGVIHRLDLNSNVDSLTSEYCKMLACSECIDGDELLFLLKFLAQADLIERTRINNATQGCILTVSGFARLSELDRTKGETSQAFVAMWFNNSTSEAWLQGFKPAIRAAGYEPIRIDEQHHANKICDEIVAEIKRSRFVVADFTQGEDGSRGGVYYEAGLAHGLGIPVIFSCRADCMDKLHFDTRQYNHLEWRMGRRPTRATPGTNFCRRW